ncbi:MAG: MYG1 family protein [Luteolibacter sp.]
MTYSQILTHPGGSHKDEFLACCLLAAGHRAPIVRREPTVEDLADLSTVVVDVGGEHDPARGNFDHHQFPRDAEPLCALSLVLKDLGVYEDAREFCDWLEPAEWFDTRGPIETAKWLGLPREVLFKLNSPIDTTLLRRFASSSELKPGEPLWEIMSWIGEDLLNYLKSLRQRLDFIDENVEFWDIEKGDEVFTVLFMPRTEPMPEEPSSGMGRYIDKHPAGKNIVGMVYPDRRGTGFGLSRHNDHPRLDFTKLEFCEDVHFAHARGFIAKTTATDPRRLRELLRMAWTRETYADS